MTEYDTTQAEIETQYSQITKYNVSDSLFPFSIEVLDQDICGQEESYGYFSTLEGKDYNLECVGSGQSSALRIASNDTHEIFS